MRICQKKNIAFVLLNFLGKKNLEKLVQKSLLHGKQKGYKKLLTGMDEIATQDEYKNDRREIWTLMSLIMVAFNLVKNVKNADFTEGNWKIAWDRLVSMYSLHTASSLLKLKNEFHKLSHFSIFQSLTCSEQGSITD